MKGFGDKKSLERTYREYARKMFNQLKRKFPQRHESLIVSEIIKKWDSLSINQKKALSDQYEQERRQFYQENQQTDAKVKFLRQFQAKRCNQEIVVKTKPIAKSRTTKECLKLNQTRDMTPEKDLQRQIELTAKKKKTFQEEQ